ncbi:hypothetical protein [Oxynema aestuarii]|jgi:ABC-type transporter Mla subunit MlaD|uniref:MotA/TolQ/ExbB proton channel domain-containing protein n=1 Tax=Oxynema aestuarii AP17 TaxID=2064643 RepID=A0A6H1TV70_9CYAN|nr:hypothetical protein [Oxynema aestuarii]QIZ70514.1 hypothetical protein HCG48_07910 [Oxynema aestuarii AP17]RMH72589.1 MAG: hypothetical protein D6680_18800 [Cyanobacteria bacterium J007]
MTETLQSINSFFVPAIFLFAAIAACLETGSIFHYWTVECGEVSRAIAQLKKARKNNTNALQINEKERPWFIRHLDGVWRENCLIAKQKGGSFVLLAFPSILNKPIPRGPVYFAPTLLTALGVLGTFTGIYLGLQNVSLDAIDETETLLQTSTQLLGGMKLAFSTSLWGLGSASVFMIILAIGERIRQFRRDNLRKKLSKIAFLQSPIELLSQLDPSSNQDVTEALIQLVEKLNELSTLNADAIGEAVGRAIVPSLGSSLTSINNELTSVRQIQENQGQAIDYLVKQMRDELIQPVIERLDESAEMTREASEAVRELKDELGGIAASLSGAISTIQTFQEETLKELQDFARSLTTILDGFRTNTEAVLEKVAKKIQEAVNESIRSMKAQREAFAHSSAQAAQSFRGIREELEQSLEKQAQAQKTMLEAVEQQTKDILEEANKAFQTQSDTIVTLGRESSTLINDARDSFIATLANIDESLQKTRNIVQEELEKFREEYEKALTLFFDEQNKRLDDVLGKQREELEKVINRLQKVFLEDATAMENAIKNSMTSIQKTAGVVYKLETELGLTSSERLEQLQQVIQLMSQEAKQIESAYQDLAKQFDEALKSGNEQLNEYLEKANESYKVNIEEFDRAMAGVCSSLDRNTHGLMDVAHYLVASAEELKNSQPSRN